MVCTACRAVVDVIVGTNSPAMISTDEFNQCPGCYGKELTPWGESHPCPRCNGTLEVDPTGPTIMWD
jgi:hypothetical protein